MDFLLDSGPWFLLNSCGLNIIITKTTAACSEEPGQKSSALSPEINQREDLTSVALEDPRLGTSCRIH